MANASAEPELGSGLIAYWPLDGHLEDVVGDHDGTARGINALEFVGLEGFGRAVKLDGISHFIEITGGEEDDFDFEDASMSVSIWFTMERGKTAQTLIGKGDSSSWRLAQFGDDRVFSFAGVQGVSLKSQKFARYGELHHAVAIVDQESGETRLYIDGEFAAQGSAPPRSRNGEARLSIGIHPENRSRIWKGLVDDVAIWDRPLTEAEVTELWNNGNARPVGEYLPDTDRDGLPDFWEEVNGFLLEAKNGEDDSDSDGLTNHEEFLLGTDPNEPDTDADGLMDGVESGTGTWIGINNTGTNPFDPDSDGDILPDGLENPDLPTTWPTKFATNPNLADTDDDGVTDRAGVTSPRDPDFRIGDIWIEKGLLKITVPTRADSYYVLHRSGTLEEIGRPIQVLTGAESEITFQERLS